MLYICMSRQRREQGSTSDCRLFVFALRRNPSTSMTLIEVCVYYRM